MSFFLALERPNCFLDEKYDQNKVSNTTLFRPNVSFRPIGLLKIRPSVVRSPEGPFYLIFLYFSWHCRNKIKWFTLEALPGPKPHYMLNWNNFSTTIQIKVSLGPKIRPLSLNVAPMDGSEVFRIDFSNYIKLSRFFKGV